jgi:nitroreductase
MNRLSQLDLWILSAYQRLERMDVPVFDVMGERPTEALQRRPQPAVLHSLPTDLPREILSTQDWLSGGPAHAIQSAAADKQVSLFFRYLASPLRFEPYNEAAIHKAVPSARCLYPLEYVIAMRDAAAVRAYRYHADFHALEAVAVPPALDRELAPGKAALIGIARLWKTAEKYGEFAPFPTLLEAGHAFAQCGHLAGLAGWGKPAVVNRNTGRAFCVGEFELPAFAMVFNRPALMPDTMGPGTAHRVATWGEKEGLAERFPRLVDIAALFDAESPGGEEQAGDVLALATPVDPEHYTVSGIEHQTAGVLETMRLRHSANDRSGMAAVQRALPSEFLDDLLTRWRQIAARRLVAPYEHRLSLCVGWMAQSGRPVGIYNLDGKRIDDNAPDAFLAKMQNIRPYPGMRFNTSALTLSLIICADPSRMMREYGDAAIRLSHLAAGAVAQDFSLAAASVGMFARPVRMMREERLEAAFPLDGQVVYQVLCGFSRRTNLTMELM